MSFEKRWRTRMAFTDAQLKRLKDDGPEWEIVNYEKLAALLTRLECAEEVCKFFVNYFPNGEAEFL